MNVSGAEQADSVSTAPFLVEPDRRAVVARRPGAAGGLPRGKVTPPPRNASAEAQWKQLVYALHVHQPATDTAVAEVVDLLLRTDAGASLVAALAGPTGVLSPRRRQQNEAGAATTGSALRSQVLVRFLDPRKIPENKNGVAAGQFCADAKCIELPVPRWLPRYYVYVGWAVESPPSPGVRSFELGTWQGGMLTQVFTPVGLMAVTLFHELTHIWFMHAHTDLNGAEGGPDTGHSTMSSDGRTYEYMHPAFRKRLEEIVSDVEVAERTWLKRNSQ